MISVYQAENVLDAHMVKGALENAGIAAFIAGEHLMGGIGTLPVMGLLQVMVDDDDAERAVDLVAEIRGEEAEAAVREDEDGAPDLMPRPV
jgi:hypothetical protein